MTTDFPEEEWKIVEARIMAMPPNIKMSIGGASVTKEELLEHLKRKDETGALLVKVHFNYLRSFKREAGILG